MALIVRYAALLTSPSRGIGRRRGRSASPWRGVEQLAAAKGDAW